MKKRTLVLGTYDTARDGLWTLSELTLTDPAYQSKFQEVIGRAAGPLDFSTVLTDGVPCYGSRTLTAKLVSSEGTRQERQAIIGRMVNELDGFTKDLVHPDYPGHYLTGRVQVQVNYNTMVQAAVTVSAICQPWLYSAIERRYTVTATEAAQTLALSNKGRRVAVPRVEITEEGASLLLVSGGNSVAVGTGTYDLPDLLLPPGDTLVQYSGTGTALISYREAVLR